jgi:hypothetical protein
MKTARALLLMNVETVRRTTQSSMRYSFDAHARRLWSFEHIHAQNSQGLSTVEQWTAWLREHRTALEALDLPKAELAALTERIDKALPTISSETFEPLHWEITQLFTARGTTRAIPTTLVPATTARSIRSPTWRCWLAMTTAC